MATTSFKRKKYGMVKEVKHRKQKAKKPDVRELARLYKAIAQNGIWQQLDNVCYAMNWWESMLEYIHASIPREYMTTQHTRRISQALALRKEGQETRKSDKDKIRLYMDAILVLETLCKLCDIKVPSLTKAIKEGEKSAAKHKGILAKLEPKHEKQTSLLNRMFPSCMLSFVVVPRIIDPVTGKDIGRKMDHTKNTFYYSRDMMKALRYTLRSKGVLALAHEEGWWLSRGMSFRSVGGQLLPDPVLWLKNYRELLEDFEEWARRGDTPARLAKKPAKKKKDITKEAATLVIDDPESEAIEQHLLNDEIVSVEEMSV